MREKQRKRETSNRRQFLYAAAASVATVGVAGCSSSTSSDGDDVTATGTEDVGPQAAFRGFVSGFQADDLSMVQAHLHPDSALLDGDRALTEDEVSEFSLEIHSLEVAVRDDERALLNARVTRTDETGNNEQTSWSTVEVRTADGEWLIYSLQPGRATPSSDQIGSVPGDGSPEATVRAFVTALDGDDAAAFRTTVYPGSRLREDFTEENIGSVDASLVAIETVTVGQEQAVVNARVEFSGGANVRDGTYWITLELLEYGGAWRVNTITEGRQTPSPTSTPTATATPTPTATATPTAAGEEPTATERTDSTAFFEGFERGIDRWDVFVDEGWATTTDVAYNGESAALANRNSSTSRLAATDVATSEHVSEFSYYWLESGVNYGGGVRLLDDAGDVVLGVATDNPQWVVDDADGVDTVADGAGYNRWVETAISFDWEASTADVSFRDLESGATYGQTHRLKDGDGVARIQLAAFTSRYGWENTSCVMAWDDISVRV